MSIFSHINFYFTDLFSFTCSHPLPSDLLGWCLLNYWFVRDLFIVRKIALIIHYISNFITKRFKKLYICWGTFPYNKIHTFYFKSRSCWLDKCIYIYPCNHCYHSQDLKHFHCPQNFLYPFTVNTHPANSTLGNHWCGFHH